MNKPKYIIFDFDGTIADTLHLALNLYNSFAHKFKTKQVNPEDIEHLRARKPQEFLKAYGISSLKLFFILLRIRKELHLHITNIDPVGGIQQALADLKKAGYRLGILTSNSVKNVELFCQHNGMQNHFDFIYSGRNAFGKEKVIRRLLKRENIRKEEVMYVGDETRDIEACHIAGIPIIAVTWGLNHGNILSALHPEHLIDHPSELLACLAKT